MIYYKTKKIVIFAHHLVVGHTDARNEMEACERIGDALARDLVRGRSEITIKVRFYFIVFPFSFGQIVKMI